MGNKKLFYILIGSIAVAFFLTIVLIIRSLGGGTTQKVTLQFWGVFDDRSAFEKVIKDFKTQNPGIDVIYRQFSFEEYENSLINNLAAGTGPDILMIHNTWLPKHGNKLKPLPAKLSGQKEAAMTVKNFQDQFVDVAYNDLVSNNQIFAMPLYVDTLALYYNKDLFNAAGIVRPPEDWAEFNQDVELLTKLDSSGNITQAGAALGTAANINRSTDILMGMMMQSGVQMTNSEHTEVTFTKNISNSSIGEVALKYYTDFANPAVRTYTWNNSQHYSIDAFSEGSVAMMFNYSHEASVLKSKSSRLNFNVAKMPQPAGVADKDISNFANYWAVAVSNKSQNYNEAWRFITYLTSKEGASNYLTATLRPSGRRDLIDLQKDDPDLQVFALQALTAKSWYQIDNQAIETIFADMIEDVNYNRRTIRDTLDNAESKVNVLMSKR